MNIVDESFNDIITQIQKEIDNEILAGMLVELGWYLVEMPEPKSEYEAWCNKYVGEYRNLWPNMLFKEEQDAVLFKLKWT